MIAWIKRLFGKSEIISEKNDDVVLVKKYQELLKRHKEILESDSLRYVVLKTFDVRDREFVRKISIIYNSEEMKFLMYDLRQQCLEKMIEGNVEVNLQMTGVLKGIDIVMKNLAGYDNIWKDVVEQENRNVQI